MKNTVRAHIALIGCNLIWGVDYPIYHYVLPEHIAVKPMLTIALAATALISLTPLLFKKHRRESIVERKDIPLLIAAGVLVALLRKAFMMISLSLTSPIDGSIISSLGPVAILILSVIAAEDRFTPRKAIGVLLGLVGAVTIILSSSSHIKGSDMLLGNLMMILCTLTTAFYTVWLKKLIRKYSVLVILRWVYCTGAIVMLPIGFDSVLKTDFQAMHGLVIAAIIFMAVAPSFLPNYLMMTSLKYTKPSLSSIYMYIQPVTATILAISLGLDTLSWSKSIGSIMIFIGVFLVATSYSHEQQLSIHRVEG